MIITSFRRQLAAFVLPAILVSQPAAAQERPGVLVERRLAEDLSLRVGDTVMTRALAGRAEPTAFVVEGIFERAADPSRIARNEYEVRFHLPDLETMLATRDRVDRFALVLRPGAHADSTARWIEGLAYGTTAYPTERLAEETSATFAVVSRFHRAIGIVTVLAGGIFLLCVMLIRVDERRRDIGMLRLIGVGRSSIFRAVVLEAVGIAVVGTIAGLAFGAVVAALVNAHYARIYDTALRFALVRADTLLLAAALGVAIGAGAGALAALRVVRLPPDRLGER